MNGVESAPIHHPLSRLHMYEVLVTAHTDSLVLIIGSCGMYPLLDLSTGPPCWTLVVRRWRCGWDSKFTFSQHLRRVHISSSRYLDTRDQLAAILASIHFNPILPVCWFQGPVRSRQVLYSRRRLSSSSSEGSFDCVWLA